MSTLRVSYPYRCLYGYGALETPSLVVSSGLLPCSTGCSNSCTIFVAGECGRKVSSGWINNTM